MASKDFNDFMDSYIDNIRTTKTAPQIKPKRDEIIEEKVPEEVSSHSVYVIKKPKPFWRQWIDSLTATKEEEFDEKEQEEEEATVTQEESFEQEYEELAEEEKKTGFFAWLGSLFSRDVNETYEERDNGETSDTVAVDPKTGNAIVTEGQSTKKEEPEEVYEETTKRSWFSWITDLFAADDDFDEEETASQAPAAPVQKTSADVLAIKEDLKQVAIIATATFKKLPPEQFKLFKESADFAAFKEILSKYDIIKK